MAIKGFVAVLLVANVISLAFGHGRLVDPASRNAAWRFGFNNPPNYNDNEQNCGGYDFQWNKNKGQCGVCGDRFNDPTTPHVSPGKYANGIITKSYKKGQEFDVEIHLTANHKGWFEFRIGEKGEGPITHAKLTHLLSLRGGGTRWHIPAKSGWAAKFTISLVLPPRLVCEHCVIQWKWNCASNWGCDLSGGCGMGHGTQENFVNCADVKITA